MGVEIKFCGLTRPADALEAARLGASFAGVIFAGGPRQLTPDRARAVLADVPPTVRRVGVFGARPAEEIGGVADEVGLEVVQLHGDATPDAVAAVRRRFGGEVWAVVRLASPALPATLPSLLGAADAVLLDALVAGTLGGSGVALPWRSLAAPLRAARDGMPARLVLAGGLRPENVAEAVAALAPDVVDVSSGVESAPGIKDHDRMRAFRDAVQGAAGRGA